MRWFLNACVPPDLSCLQTVSHQYFWYHTTLSASGHIEEGVESLVVHLTLGIFAAWCLLFLIMITGLKTPMPVSQPDHQPHYPFMFMNPNILRLPTQTHLTPSC